MTGRAPGKLTAIRTYVEWLLVRCARLDRTIAYGHLCRFLEQEGVANLHPRGRPLTALLGAQVSADHDAGRPLLSAVVVRADT